MPRVARLARWLLHSGGSPELSQLAAAWRASAGERVTRRWQQTRVSLLRHAVAAVGDIRLDELDRDRLLEIQRYCLDEAGLSASTTNKLTHNVLRAACRDAGVDLPGLWGSVRQLREDSEPVNAAWTLAERDLILAACRRLLAPQYAAFVGFAFATGARLEELLALRWSDLDTTRRTCRIYFSRAGEVVTPCKTRRSRRSIPLPGQALAALAMLPRAGHGGEVVANLGAPVRNLGVILGSGDALVFTTPAGHPIDLANFRRRQWARVMGELAGKVRRLPLRCTRHTFATACLDGEMTVGDVAAILGDRPATVLSRYYRSHGPQLAAIEAALAPAH